MAAKHKDRITPAISLTNFVRHNFYTTPLFLYVTPRNIVITIIIVVAPMFLTYDSYPCPIKNGTYLGLTYDLLGTYI